MKTTFTNNKFTLSLIDHNYYELTINDNTEIKTEDVLLIIDGQKQLCGKKLPLLISGGQYSTTDIDTLKFTSQNINMPYSKAAAFISSSVSQKLLGNFYLKIYKPQRPTKFFNNRESALIWIEQYL